MSHFISRNGQQRVPSPQLRLIGAALALIVGVPLLVYGLSVGVTAALMPDCVRCHMASEDFAAPTQERAHASVQCAACHGGTTVQSRLAFGNAQVLGMYVQVVDIDPTISSVSSDVCTSCHDSITERMTESSGLRILHGACTPTRTCTECHSPTAHGEAVSWPRATTMEMCFDCHGSAGLSDECTLCHTGRLPGERLSYGPFAVTHGPNYLQTHGMGSMNTCGPCHEPSMCAACHGSGLPHGADFVATHRGPAGMADAECMSCHLDAFCIDCHEYEMPHPVEFTPDHAEIVESSGSDACERCHDERDCTRCHEMHVHPTTLDQLDSLGVDVGGEGRR